MKKRLGDLVHEAQPGFACGKNVINGILQIRMNNVRPDGSWDFSKERFVPLDAVSNMQKYTLREGDVLFNATNSPEQVGKSAYVSSFDRDAVFSNHFLRLRTSGDLDPKYLVHYLGSQFRKGVFAAGCKQWVNQATFSAERLFSLEIPLPPLEEQRRIAAILDKAEGLASLQIRASLIHREWLSSVYSESFADSDSQIGISIEEALEDQILLLHKDGNHGSSYPRADDFGAEGVPFISAKSIDDSGAIIDAQVVRLSEEKAKSLRIGWLEPGDVLLAHNASVGKTALYEGQYQRAVIGTSLTAFRPNPNHLNSHYLFHYLSSPSFQAALAADMSQTTRNQVPITAQRKLALRIPPLSKQEEFAAIAVSAKRLARKRVESFRSVDILRISLFSALLAL